MFDIIEGRSRDNKKEIGLVTFTGYDVG